MCIRDRQVPVHHQIHAVLLKQFHKPRGLLPLVKRGIVDHNHQLSIRRLLCRDGVVQCNRRVYKALRDQLAAVLDELRRIEAGQGVNDELLDTIQMIATIMNGMQEDFAYDR